MRVDVEITLRLELADAAAIEAAVTQLYALLVDEPGDALDGGAGVREPRRPAPLPNRPDP